MLKLSFMEKLAYGRIVLGVIVFSIFGFGFQLWAAGTVLGLILVLGGISGLTGLSSCCKVDDKGEKVCTIPAHKKQNGK